MMGAMLRRVIPLLALSSVLLGAAACSERQAGEIVRFSEGKRPAAPAISGDLLGGGSYDLAGKQGKVVVINFWGSWCAPCRAEADDLESTYQATKAKRVAFIGVNTRDDRDAAVAFERGRVTYPSVYDPDGRVALKFDVTQVTTPSTLILDRQGRIAVAMRRATIISELQPLVERVAAEGTG